MAEEILETARLAARVGAEIVSRHYGGAIEIETKATNDYVSRVDRDSEEAILALIRSRHPDHDVLGEETGLAERGDSDYLWMVDPLDGTSNYLHGLPIFAVSVACWRAGRPVACVIVDPNAGREYSASAGGGAWLDGTRLRVSDQAGVDGAFVATGFPFKAHRAIDAYLEVFRSIFLRATAIRRPGAAAIDLANTAAGVYDGFFEFRLGAWDLAAGVLLIEEAGGVVSDLDGGDRYLETGNIIAGAPAVHEDLLRLVAEVTSEAGIEAIDPSASR